MKYLCLKDYVMDSKEVAFKKGNTYNFNKDYKTKKNEREEAHDLYDEKDFYRYFKPFKERKDKVVSQVLNKFKERSKVGIKKYGTTLHENELTIPEWINHAIEEQMDNILYLTKLKNEQPNK